MGGCQKIKRDLARLYTYVIVTNICVRIVTELYLIDGAGRAGFVNNNLSVIANELIGINGFGASGQARAEHVVNEDILPHGRHTRE